MNDFASATSSKATKLIHGGLRYLEYYEFKLVREALGERQTMLMPVLRHDNFTDTTADVKLDRIFVPVGNQKGGALTTISLRQLLANPGRYLSLPRAGRIAHGSLLAERDSHALVSAQHAFLPVPRAGKVKFWPVIFNYQSSAQNPAVLTILVTRQGTSVTVIDSERGMVSSGEEFSGEDREADMKSNVERILEAHVGTGNAIVELNLDVVTESELLTEQRFDPQQRALIAQESEESTDQSSNSQKGAVTAASNLPEV